MSVFESLADHWWWLLAAALLGILEIFIPGVFLVWTAIAAGITGLIVAVAPMPIGYQLGTFALLAFAAVYAGRRQYERNPVASSDPQLNERTARLIGRTVTVETAIQNGEGRVKIGDSLWLARGPDAPAGSQVVIVGAQGSCLSVEPAAA